MIGVCGESQIEHAEPARSNAKFCETRKKEIAGIMLYKSSGQGALFSYF